MTAPAALYLQPIVAVADPQTIIGYEALARFPDMPTERAFEAAATDGTLIDLDMACFDLAVDLLPEVPQPLYLAVNATVEALHRGDVLSHLARLTSADAARLVVEVSERTLIDPLLAYRTIWQLHAKAVRVALDDVGRAYASSQSIIQVNPDIIKIDQSIVEGLDRFPGNRAITRAMAGIGLELRCIVAAEGVETQRQADWLAEVGIRYAQGYLYAEPRPAAEVLG